MKVIHIITSINKGGAENQLYDLICQQKKYCNQIKVIYFRGDSYWKKKFKKIDVESIKISLNNNYSFFKFLYCFLKLNYYFCKFKPDIVHSHLSLSEILVFLSKIIFRHSFKFVITKHLDSFYFEGSHGQNKFFSGLSLEKIVFKICDHVIFISKSVQKYFVKKVNLSNSKFSLIYYGIDLKNNKINHQVRDKIIKKLKIKKNKKILLTIARAVNQKRLDILINGFNEFQKENPESILILISQGKKINQLKSLVKDLKLEKKIVWVSYTDYINEYFSIADVFCLTSDYEGLGLVLLESFRMKVPIIASNKSAIKEIVKHNKNGLLFNNNNYISLSNKLNELFTKPNKKIKFIKHSNDILKKKFNIINQNLKIIKIYKALN